MASYASSWSLRGGTRRSRRSWLTWAAAVGCAVAGCSSQAPRAAPSVYEADLHDLPPAASAWVPPDQVRLGERIRQDVVSVLSEYLQPDVLQSGIELPTIDPFHWYNHAHKTRDGEVTRTDATVRVGYARQQPIGVENEYRDGRIVMSRLSWSPFLDLAKVLGEGEPYRVDPGQVPPFVPRIPVERLREVAGKLFRLPANFQASYVSSNRQPLFHYTPDYPKECFTVLMGAGHDLETMRIAVNLDEEGVGNLEVQYW